MPEILTESFCERCGTRYTFESAAPRTTRLKGVKVLSRGLKNFVMSDDTSLDEAMAAARNDTDREQTAQQLDAFHKTFNFCMQCRQYTCATCWNEAEGRCLTCAPHLGQSILEAPFPNLDVAAGLDRAMGTNGNGTNGHVHEPPLEPMSWPTSDLLQGVSDEPSPLSPAPGEDADEARTVEPIDAIARLAALDGEAGSLPEAVVTDAEDALDAAVEAAVDPSPEMVPAPPAATTPPATSDAEGIDARAAAAAAATARLLRSFRPGQSLDAALDAYEREQAATQQPESSDAAPVDLTADPEPVEQATAPAPVPAASIPDPEPLETLETLATLEPEAVQPQAVDAEPAHPVDDIAQPTWRILAPDPTPAEQSPTIDAPAAPTIAASAEPQWPAQPQWPSHTPSAGLPFLGRPATPSGGIEALWAESAREVSAVPTTGPIALAPLGSAKVAGGVQPCVSCGLSLSATARFCRRCGSRQA